MRILWAPDGAPGAEIAALVAKGHEVKTIDREGLPRWVPESARPGALAARAAKAVALFRPDVAWVEIGPDNVPMAAAIAAARIPLVLAFESSARSIEEAGIGLVASTLAAKRTVARSDEVASHAKERLGAKTVEILPQVIDLGELEPKDRDEAKRALGIPKEQRVVALAGSLDEEQRLDLLAEAHRRLAGIALLVAGDGPGAMFVQAMSITARPSSPVLDLGDGSPKAREIAIGAADVCVSARTRASGRESLEYAALGRRQALLFGIKTLEQLYPNLGAAHVASEPTPIAFAHAIGQALEEEAKRGALPRDLVDAARSRIGDRAGVIEGLLESAR
jgi:glycosyltransferase involved in cell wall biosynthesis